MAGKKKTNRANFGNVRQLPSGRWQARYPDEVGAPMKAPRTFDTSKDAWDHIHIVKADRTRGLYTDPRRGERLLSDYGTEWIANGGSRGNLAIRTRELYEDLLARHIAPSIGARAIGQVTPSTVRTWYTALGKELAERATAPRKSGKTAPRIATGKTRQRQAYSLLRGIMATAVNDGLIGKNPCQINGAGQVKTPERPLMSIADFVRLVEAHPVDLRPVLHMALGGHLRLGEVVGLQRKDVDPAAGTLTVRDQIIYSRTAGEVRTQTKTDITKTVDLPAGTVAALQAYLKTVPKALPAAPLFVRADGRRLTRAQVQHAWNKAREAVDLPQYHFHDLKGAGLTLTAQGGASIAEIKQRGGHTTTAAAMVYQHAAKDRGKEIAAKLNEAIYGG